MKTNLPDLPITLDGAKSPVQPVYNGASITLADDIDNSESDEVKLSSSTRIVWITALMLAVIAVWAWFGTLDEVSNGTGKVIPSTREQVLQSLDGGILGGLNVREGSKVEAGQIVAWMDPTRSESNVGESAARYRAALASASRLTAEVNDLPLTFPAELDKYESLKATETRLYNTRRAQLKGSETQINEALDLVKRELQITERLATTGAASNVEVLRLRRQKADLDLKLTDLRSQYYVQAREEMAKANAEADSLAEVIKGRSDSVDRLTVRSPVRGIVKNIKVNTIGGVIPPNGDLMEIVPVDDRLLIEARLSPRDIAFIHPGQNALVKISAYDYAIYGGLHGVVETISPDTIQDEVKPEIYYYRVFIRTDVDYLQNKNGKHFSISPGMIASVDIKTGEKTVMDYLFKPFNRAKEALRER
ncbi:HlyD family type I secretion periplasmic adaptor subunit [Erwinia sp. S38]|uniref:HlyD family type I secretion periplasmic adaptor subunit n=1 Tax=Erwinia sp. S38 TaxID=2769338 RepID=UPI00190E4CC2|nr:HlyD family type I secretion periplasmic adaptor subunit [Erwinia sp. S38]MBK0004299.1 HlyD family type I secretion periplasmic adaptor subunit [Erwinia sp. S38]